jgi:hypothetical protein
VSNQIALGNSRSPDTHARTAPLLSVAVWGQSGTERSTDEARWKETFEGDARELYVNLPTRFEQIGPTHGLQTTFCTTRRVALEALLAG